MGVIISKMAAPNTGEKPGVFVCLLIIFILFIYLFIHWVCYRYFIVVCYCFCLSLFFLFVVFWAGSVWFRIFIVCHFIYEVLVILLLFHDAFYCIVVVIDV